MTPIDLVETTMRAKIDSLETAATVSLTIAISVALIAATMGITQLKSHPKVKYLVLALGMIVPVLQVVQVQVFPHSHQSYKRMAISCTRILVDMDLDHKRLLLAQMDDTVQRSELLGSLNEQQARCLEQGLDTPDTIHGALAMYLTPSGLFGPRIANAAESTKAPSWISEPQNEPRKQCFVGKAASSSLEAARSASYRHGIDAAYRFYAKTLPEHALASQTELQRQVLSRILAGSGTKEREYYTFDVTNKQFQAYSLICIVASRVESAIELFSVDQDVEASRPMMQGIQMQAVGKDSYSSSTIEP